MYIKAAVVIHKDGKYLLVQERNERVYGQWNWSQGRLDEGETPEEAALREGKEETGLDLRVERKLAMLTDTFPDIKELHVFLASPISGSVSVQEDEILAAKWVSLEELIEMKESLVGPWVLDTIRDI